MEKFMFQTSLYHIKENYSLFIKKISKSNKIFAYDKFMAQLKQGKAVFKYLYSIINSIQCINTV